MSFWDSELGNVTGNAADAFAKSFTQIPDGTMALARIESFANAEYNGNKYLSLDWTLIDGDFRGQKVNQKLRVYGDPRAKDPIQAHHRALNMLKLVYQLYGIKPSHANDPTDADLSIFKGKTAGIKVRETEPNEKGKQYNWVSEVHDAKGFKSETGISVVVTHSHNTQGPMDSALDRHSRVSSQDLGDDIPF